MGFASALCSTYTPLSHQPTGVWIDTFSGWDASKKKKKKVTKCKCVQNIKEVSSLEIYSGCYSPKILTSKISWIFRLYENSNH